MIERIIRRDCARYRCGAGFKREGFTSGIMLQHLGDVNLGVERLLNSLGNRNNWFTISVDIVGNKILYNVPVEIVYYQNILHEINVFYKIHNNIDH